VRPAARGNALLQALNHPAVRALAPRETPADVGRAIDATAPCRGKDQRRVSSRMGMTRMPAVFFS
jgi:hypothetical protein